MVKIYVNLGPPQQVILGRLPSKFAAQSTNLGLKATILRFCCDILAVLCYHTVYSLEIVSFGQAEHVCYTL